MTTLNRLDQLLHTAERGRPLDVDSQGRVPVRLYGPDGQPLFTESNPAHVKGEVTLTGRNTELLPPTELADWTQVLTEQTVDVPTSDAGGVLVVLEHNTVDPVPMTVQFEHEVREGVFVPWRDGLGNPVEVSVSTDSPVVLGPYRGFPRFSGGRIRLSVPDKAIGNIWSYRNFTSNSSVRHVAVGADGSVYVSEYSSTNRKVYKFFADGTMAWVYTCPSDYRPRELAVGTDGSVYVGTYVGNSIIKLDSAGEFVWQTQVADSAIEIALDEVGGFVYYAQGDVLHRMNLAGTVDTAWTFDAGAPINDVFAKNGEVWVAGSNRTVYKVDTEQANVSIWSHTDLRTTDWVRVDDDGTVVVMGSRSNPTQPAVIKIASDGTHLWTHVLEIDGAPRGASISRPGKVYFGTHTGQLCKVDYTGGAPVMIWQETINSGVRDVAAFGTTIYEVADADGPELRRFDDYFLDVFRTTVSVREVL